MFSFSRLSERLSIKGREREEARPRVMRKHPANITFHNCWWTHFHLRMGWRWDANPMLHIMGACSSLF
ncbi:Uncharacterized protein HZ326_1505 [Fusarium oxysporum f. sp. albedinis]|nr:Uncharacterized protein HZ326_1505 [Fusarium oxysporum f. sp. albedinis]